MSANRRLLLIATLIIAVSIALSATPSMAQESVELRTLAEHTYPATPRFEDPFLNTSVGFSLGAGQAVGLEVPLLNVDGEPQAILEGNLAFLILQLAYQQRVASWISVGLAADVAARLGTTTVSLIAEGGTAFYGPEFFAKIKLLEQERWATSFKVAAYKRNLYDISPLDFARDVIDEGDIDSTVTLLTSSNGWRFEAGFSGVYTFSPRLGAKGYILTRPGERLRQEDIVDSPWAAGAALSWDANPFGAPIGLVGSFVYRSQSELSSDLVSSATEFGLGIFYKERRELVLGLDLGFQTLNQKDSDETTDAATALLVMRYDF